MASIATQAAQQAAASAPVEAARTALNALKGESKQLGDALEAASDCLRETDSPFAKLQENLSEELVAPHVDRGALEAAQASLTAAAASDDKEAIAAAEQAVADVKQRIQAVVDSLQLQQDELLGEIGVAEARLSKVDSAVANAPFAAVGMATVALGGKVPQAAKASATRARESGAEQSVINSAAGASATWCGIEAGKEPAQVSNSVVSAVMQAGGASDEIDERRDSALVEALTHRTGLLGAADVILKKYEEINAMKAQIELFVTKIEAAEEALHEIEFPGPDQDAAQDVVTDLEAQHETTVEKMQFNEQELEGLRKAADAATTREQETVMALGDAPYADIRMKFQMNMSSIPLDSYERTEFLESVIRGICAAVGEFETKRLEVLKVIDGDYEAGWFKAPPPVDGKIGSWFRGQSNAPDSEIAGWFRGATKTQGWFKGPPKEADTENTEPQSEQGEETDKAGGWFKETPKATAADSEIAGWFRSQRNESDETLADLFRVGENAAEVAKKKLKVCLHLYLHLFAVERVHSYYSS